MWHVRFVMWHMRFDDWLGGVVSKEVKLWCSIGCVHVCIEGMIVDLVESFEWVSVSSMVRFVDWFVGNWLMVGWCRRVVGWCRRVVRFWLWFWLWFGMMNLCDLESIEDGESINSGV